MRGMNRHFNGAILAGLAISCSLLPAAWGQTADSPRKSSLAACDRAGFQVVVDVGHTLNGGARSARGVAEYDYNLRLATEIVQALADNGFAKIILQIMDNPKRAALFKRVERANKLPADLLVSIHHDSVPKQFMETWEFEGETRSFSDRFKGHSIFISNDNADRKGSLLFGQLLGRAMKTHGLQYTPHYTQAFMGSRRRELVDAAAGVYRYDQLIVLRYTRVPAVLLEAGSIINRDEELELRRPERRALITESVVDAVAGFCALRSPANEAISARRRAKLPER
jgi:N-acetylmuramoyl-L-alanine amidase